jgi:hypothetical protein
MPMPNNRQTYSSVCSIVTGQEIKNNHTTANLYNYRDVSHFILLPSFQTDIGIFFPVASALSRLSQ